MSARRLRERLSDERDGEEEPAEGIASPLKNVSLALKWRKGGLAASGCFHGHERLLSMAPMVIEGVGVLGIGVLDRLAAVIGSWRLYGSTSDMECLV